MPLFTSKYIQMANPGIPDDDFDQIINNDGDNNETKFQKFHELVTRFLRGNEASNYLYRHQINALLGIRNFLNNNPLTPAILVAPVGSGKAGIITLLPYVLNSPKTLILTPSLLVSHELGMQFGIEVGPTGSFYASRHLLSGRERLDQFIEPGTVILHSHDVVTMDSYNLCIVNIQRLSGNSKTRLSSNQQHMEMNKDIQAKLELFTTLIVDEAHHALAQSWTDVINLFKQNPEKHVVFVTATPFSGQSANPLFTLPNGKIQYAHYTTKQDLVDRNIIRSSRHVTLNPSSETIQLILNQHDELNRAVKHKAIVVVSTKREAETLADEFGNVATYYTSDCETDQNLLRFRDEDIVRILVVRRKLLEGMETTSAGCSILLLLGAITKFFL